MDKDYLNVKNYNQDIKERRRVEDVINKMKRQIRINGEKHTATFHYITKYHYIPLWILVKVLSFGLINELFGILKDEDQKEIADFYRIDKDILKVYLQLLSNYRNLCAHEDIVYEHRTQVFIEDSYYHAKLDIPKNNLGEYTKGKNDIFALIIILKQVLQTDRFREMMAEINRCFDIFDLEVNTIDNSKLLDKMGFPDNYMDIVDMQGGLNE